MDLAACIPRLLLLSLVVVVVVLLLLFHDARNLMVSISASGFGSSDRRIMIIFGGDKRPGYA